MPFSFGQLTLLGVSLLSCTKHAVATDSIPAINHAAPAAVFQDSGTSIDGQFVFAVSLYQPNNTSNATTDLYLHMSAPSAYQWMGVGLGRSMTDGQGPVMWIAYPSQNGTGMTLSVRHSTGHREPEYLNPGDTSTGPVAASMGCEQIWGDDLVDDNTVTGGANGTMTLNAVCRGAPTWNGTDIAAPTLQNTPNNTFIYAVGPHDGYGNHGSRRLRSDSPQASLNMHSYHGSFTMQMEPAVTNASSTAGIPQPNGADGTIWITENAASASAPKNDRSYALLPAAHGIIMCLAFVIVFPAGAMVLRLLQRVILHAVVQAVGFMLFCIAMAVGIVFSTKSNWSMQLLSAHQVIGVLLFIALAAQLGAGILHHRIFQKNQRPTVMGKIHKYLGPTVILVGILNAPLGFLLADNPRWCFVYVGMLVTIALVFAVVFERRRRRRRASSTAPITLQGYQYSQFGSGSPGAPPMYGRTESFKTDDADSKSWDREPMQPRPMV